MKPSAPPAPDYAGAAQATAQGNLANAQVSQTANMVNQVTPYGSVNYSPTTLGYIDSSGNQISVDQYRALSNPLAWGNISNGGRNPDLANYTPIQQWTQTVNMSPDQQAIFNQNQQINQQLGDVAQQGVGYVQDALNSPLSTSGMQQLQDPSVIQQQASDAAYQNATRYLDPQFQQSQAALESQLANQGITRGSQAYDQAMQNAAMQKEQAYGGARNQAYLQGMQGANQLYGQSMGNRQQQLSEAQLMQQNPINMLNAVRTGQQMQVAQQPQVGVSHPGQMANVAGPDLLGAANATGQYNQGLYNADMAGYSNTMGGLFSLGGAAMMSDIRTKENIVKVGDLDGINLYMFDYKEEFKPIAGYGRYIGVMAQEIESDHPDVVITGDDGYKRVDYSKLGFPMMEV